MRVVLFGGSGMVGRGVLAACLEDSRVEGVLSVGRSALPVVDPKLREVVKANVTELDDLASELASADACFFCLGVMSAAYERARPGGTFCYVSGQGTDSTERGRLMWARVKGRTENRLLAMRLNGLMQRAGQPVVKAGSRSLLPDQATPGRA